MTTSFMSHGINSITKFKHHADNGDCVSFTIEYHSGDYTEYSFWGLSHDDAKDFTDRNNNISNTKLVADQAREIELLKSIIKDYKKAVDVILDTVSPFDDFSYF